MVVLTAIIRCKPDKASTVLDALNAVGRYVKGHEPDTLNYRVIRSTADPAVLITHECFTDEKAMATHNEGDGSKAFFAATEGMLEGVEIHIGEDVRAD